MGFFKKYRIIIITIPSSITCVLCTFILTYNCIIAYKYPAQHIVSNAHNIQKNTLSCSRNDKYSSVSNKSSTTHKRSKKKQSLNDGDSASRNENSGNGDQDSRNGFLFPQSLFNAISINNSPSIITLTSIFNEHQDLFHGVKSDLEKYEGYEQLEYKKFITNGGNTHYNVNTVTKHINVFLNNILPIKLDEFAYVCEAINKRTRSEKEEKCDYSREIQKKFKQKFIESYYSKYKRQIENLSEKNTKLLETYKTPKYIENLNTYEFLGIHYAIITEIVQQYNKKNLKSSSVNLNEVETTFKKVLEYLDKCFALLNEKERDDYSNLIQEQIKINNKKKVNLNNKIYQINQIDQIRTDLIRTDLIRTDLMVKYKKVALDTLDKNKIKPTMDLCFFKRNSIERKTSSFTNKKFYKLVLESQAKKIRAVAQLHSNRNSFNAILKGKNDFRVSVNFFKIKRNYTSVGFNRNICEIHDIIGKCYVIEEIPLILMKEFYILKAPMVLSMKLAETNDFKSEKDLEDNVNKILQYHINMFDIFLPVNVKDGFFGRIIRIGKKICGYENEANKFMIDNILHHFLLLNEIKGYKIEFTSDSFCYNNVQKLENLLYSYIKNICEFYCELLNATNVIDLSIIARCMSLSNVLEDISTLDNTILIDKGSFKDKDEFNNFRKKIQEVVLHNIDNIIKTNHKKIFDDLDKMLILHEIFRIALTSVHIIQEDKNLYIKSLENIYTYIIRIVDDQQTITLKEKFILNLYYFIDSLTDINGLTNNPLSDLQQKINQHPIMKIYKLHEAIKQCDKSNVDFQEYIGRKGFYDESMLDLSNQILKKEFSFWNPFFKLDRKNKLKEAINEKIIKIINYYGALIHTSQDKIEIEIKEILLFHGYLTTLTEDDGTESSNKCYEEIFEVLNNMIKALLQDKNPDINCLFETFFNINSKMEKLDFLISNYMYFSTFLEKDDDVKNMLDSIKNYMNELYKSLKNKLDMVNENNDLITSLSVIKKIITLPHMKCKTHVHVTENTKHGDTLLMWREIQIKNYYDFFSNFTEIFNLSDKKDKPVLSNLVSDRKFLGYSLLVFDYYRKSAQLQSSKYQDYKKQVNFYIECYKSRLLNFMTVLVKEIVAYRCYDEKGIQNFAKKINTSNFIEARDIAISSLINEMNSIMMVLFARLKLGENDSLDNANLIYEIYLRVESIYKILEGIKKEEIFMKETDVQPMDFQINQPIFSKDLVDIYSVKSVSEKEILTDDFANKYVNLFCEFYVTFMSTLLHLDSELPKEKQYTSDEMKIFLTEISKSADLMKQAKKVIIITLFRSAYIFFEMIFKIIESYKIELDDQYEHVINSLKQQVQNDRLIISEDCFEPNLTKDKFAINANETIELGKNYKVTIGQVINNTRDPIPNILENNFVSVKILQMIIILLKRLIIKSNKIILDETKQDLIKLNSQYKKIVEFMVVLNEIMTIEDLKNDNK